MVKNGNSENQESKKYMFRGWEDKSLKGQMKRKYLQCYFLEAYYYYFIFCFLLSLLPIKSGSQMTAKGNQNTSGFVKSY